MTTIERIAARYRKQNNLDFIQGVLGTEDGRVLVDEAVSNQLVYVRLRQADGYKPPSRHYVRGNIPLSYAGVPVILQRNENNQLEVVGVYREGGVVAGFGDGLGNTSTAENMWTDAGKWPYLYCTAMTGGDGTQATASTTEVGVSEWNYIDANGNYTLFPGGLIDLSGDIPGAGEWLVALVYLNQDNELASSISTAQDENIDPLDFTDRQEALDNAINLFVPIRFWVLRGGATTITNKDRLEDARIWINDRVGLGSNVRLLDGITKTVKAAGGDYTTIQSAIDFFEGGKLVTDCTIEVDAGTYTENVVISAALHTTGDGQLLVQGDTRDLAGLSYVNGVDQTAVQWTATTAYVLDDIRLATSATGLMFRCTVAGTSGAAEPLWPTAIGGTVVDGTATWVSVGVPNNRPGATNGGFSGGGCEMVRSGGSNEILTVTVSSGSPDFATDGWGNGDKVLAWDGAAVSELTIASTAANAITVTTSWPAGFTSGIGQGFILEPDRKIKAAAGASVTVNGNGVQFEGFFIESPAAQVALVNSSRLRIDNCGIYGQARGIQVFGAGSFLDSVDSACTIFGGTSAWAVELLALGVADLSRANYFNGKVVSSGGALFVTVLSTLTATTSIDGFECRNSYLQTVASYTLNASRGFISGLGDAHDAQACFADGCTTGFYNFASFVNGNFSGARNCTTGYRAFTGGAINALNTSANSYNNTTNYNPATSNTAATDGAVIYWS
jgi:hypothetical protein